MSTREENINKIIEGTKTKSNIEYIPKSEAVSNLKKVMKQFDSTFKELAK